MNLLARLQSYLEWLITHPVAELSRAQRSLRFAVNLVRHCSRELHDNDAAQMAAALTYRTIFSLVPLLMVSLFVFRLFGDMGSATRQLQSIADFLLNYDADTTRPEAAAFKRLLEERLLEIMSNVSELSFEAIGAIGALLLVWAAIRLLVSLEIAANRIYQAPRGRGWPVRVGIYWTVLTLGPILLLVTLFVADVALEQAEALPLVGPLFSVLGAFASLAGIFLAFLVLYKLMPNTRVRWAPALWGALVAAVVWQVFRWGFGLYVSQALPYLKFYGAIGLVPLFLYFLYLGWLTVLFGLEIAFTLQAMRGRVFEGKDRRGAFVASDPQWLVPVALAIARRAGSGRLVRRQELAEELDLRLDSVSELIDRLEDEGLVHHVSRRGKEVGLTLALAPERIRLARLLEIAAGATLGARPRTGPGWDALAAIHEQAGASAGNRTLAEIL